MRDSVEPDGLTELQRRFVEALRRGTSGIDAAREAGYGGSDETLMVRASKLRKNPKIAAALEQAAGTAVVRAPAIEIPKPQPGPQTTFADCTADIAIAGGAAGGGKALRLDEAVPTPEGWTTIGALEVGNAIFDDQGRPCVVTHVHAVDPEPEVWRLTFDDGTSIEASGDHHWLTFDDHERLRLLQSTPSWRVRRRAKRNKGEPRSMFVRAQPPPTGTLRTTAEIAATLRCEDGRTNHAIPMARALELPPVELALDPYLLGAWLGDGTTKSGSITSADAEVLAEFDDAGFARGAVRFQGRARQQRFLGLQHVLRALAVLGHKHIPTVYLRASIEQRLALLQGLMDTDGYASKRDGACEFVTTSPVLRDGIVELLGTLGIKAGVSEGLAMLNGRVTGPKWRINFTPPVHVFRLARKRSRQRLASRPTTQFRYVVAAERVASSPMRCITVSSKRGLFLVGRSFHVTHNSWSLLFEPLKWATQVNGRWCLPSGMRAVLFRRSHPELMGGGGLWDESHKMYRPLGGRARKSPAPDWIFPGADGGDARIELRHLQRDSDVYGHQGRQYAFVGFDELTHFTAHQFWYLVSRLRSTCGVKPYLRATCNPDPDSFVAKLVAWWIGDDGYAIPERSGVVRWLVRRSDDSIEWFDSEAEALATVRWVVRIKGKVVKLDNEAEARELADANGVEAKPDPAPLSFTFIATKLADNEKGDPTYRDRLMVLGRVERERLLGDEARGGNWRVRASAGMVFRRSDFKLADHPPAPVIQTVRFWDKASSEPTPKHPNPDWTRGPRVSLCDGGLLWIDDLVSLQGRPNDVLSIMRRTAESDTIAVTIGLWQDTGGAGVVDVDVTADALAGFVVEKLASFSSDTSAIHGKHRSTKPKRAFASAWAPWVEKGRVYVLRAPWTEELLNECDGFPDARFDDIVDGISGAFQVLIGQGATWWELIKKAAAQTAAEQKRSER